MIEHALRETSRLAGILTTSPGKDWEQRRYELSKEILLRLPVDDDDCEKAAKYSVKQANALIKELKKTTNLTVDREKVRDLFDTYKNPVWASGETERYAAEVVYAVLIDLFGNENP